MDLPFGELLENNVLLKNIDIKTKISSLIDSGFSGYAVITAEGKSGIEEGSIVIHQNKIIGSVFDYLRFGKKILGDAAFQHFLNSSRAEHGVLDIVALSKQQIELIIAFNEKIELGRPVASKDFQKIMPEKYNPQIGESFLGKQALERESKFEVFKKVGLAEFTRKLK